MALMWIGDIAPAPERARTANEEVVRLADAQREPDVRYAIARPDTVLSEAASNLAALEKGRSLARALDWQGRAVDIAERLGDRRLLASFLAELADLHLLGGDVDAADRALARAEELIEGVPAGRIQDRV